ncbi:glycoside hydrolase family 26 protein [Flavobacterium sp. TMP13]|uniref:glycoside hydrolase family 26 protein n=1 Tax=Flavobacterium sp. TMP13 TaxID=3425950 RepID=UPI003D777B87
MKNFSVLILAIVLFASCKDKKSDAVSNELAQADVLLENLKSLTKKGVLFGHQDDLAYGNGWAYEDGNSDVKRVVGDYPAVYGWDLGHIELGDTINLDGVPFSKMKQYALEVYKRGGINTFSWHGTSPYNRKTAWDTTATIKHLLKEPKFMAEYHKDLDKVAEFLISLKDENGNTIPVIYRPLHELTGSWFWWGKKQTSPEDFKKFWCLTLDYLKSKGVTNALYAFSTSEVKTKGEFLERYPGDRYVDIIGVDAYHMSSVDGATFSQGLKKTLAILNEVGKEHNKLMALTEIGSEQIPDPKWWTEVLFPTIEEANLSYVLLWRNGRPDHYYVPYPGQTSAKDFEEFYKNPKVLFQKELTAEKIYQKK